LGLGGALGPTRRVCDALNPTRLYLSRPTVASHLTGILTKLGLSSRSQIAACVFRRQL